MNSRRIRTSPRTARSSNSSVTERHDCCADPAAAPDPFPSSPASARRAWLPRSGFRSRLANTDDDRRRRAVRTTSMPLARSVLKNRAGSPMPANASTRLPRSDATCASSGFRCADNTGLPCAAISAATGSAALPSPTTISASVRASCGRSGARRGPAGNTCPLPMPRSLSITISDASLTIAGLWKPSSIRITVAPCDRASGTPSARLRDTTTGSAPASIKRLVADIGSRVPDGIDPDRPAQLSAIAAAEHDRRLAEFAQQLRQRQHGRRLAGAADVIIADAEHRNAGIQSPALQALCGDGAIERGERLQQMRVERGRAVPEARLTHWRLPSRSATAADTARAR